MSPAAARGSRGFTYLGVLFIIAVLGLTGAAASTLWSFQDQRQREKELLFIGRQFQDALASYRHAQPANAGAGSDRPSDRPSRLEDLLRDPRVPFVRRHLRQVYVDPFTGRAEWGLVRDAQQRIVGIHSLSARAPIRRARLGVVGVNGQARSYRDWVFRVPEDVAPPTS